MAGLHRSHGGDTIRPSSATFPCHGRALVNAARSPFSGEKIYTTARPPRPRTQDSLVLPPAPSTPSPRGASARCGGRWRGIGMGCFGDSEMKRRRRVAAYKAYAVEGKVKSSLRRGLRWLKRKCSGILRV